MSSQPAPEEGFASLGLGSRLCETLAALGYEEPTPIQRKTIPRLLDGVDLVGADFAPIEVELREGGE